MSLRLRCLPAILLAAVVFRSTPALDAQSSPTVLAVVFENGELLPVAVHSGQEWWNLWPSKQDESELPPDALDRVPASWLPPGVTLPTEWTVLRFDGTRERVHAVRPVRLDIMGQYTVGLLTDMKSARPRCADCDPADIGVAFAGPATVERILTLKTSAADWRRIWPQLRPLIDAKETEAWETWLQERRASVQRGGLDIHVPVSPSKRAATTTRDKAIVYKFPRDASGHSVYFFDLSKEYEATRVLDDPECVPRALIDGTLSTTSTQKILASDISANAVACDVMRPSLVPLATVRVDDRLLWIIRWDFEDGIEYELTSPTRDRPFELRTERPR